MSSGGSSKPAFVDDYNSDQSTLAYGKHINRYGKYIVMKTLISVIANENKQNDKFRMLESAFKNLPTDIDEAWAQVLSKADVHSTEGLCMLAYEAIGAGKDSLLYSLITTYAKVAPLKSADDWFDNFRLTGIANSMNLLIWRDDADGVYGVGRSPQPINSSIELDFAKVKRFLVRPLREFIIRNSLYPENADLDGGCMSTIEQSMSDKEICDECYAHFPFYFGGAHGCDVFGMREASLTMSEIKAFCKRYPSAIVGYILNTETYRSGRGQHWLSIAFSGDRCSIINSSGSGLESFHDGGALSKSIKERFAAINYNDKRLQNDGYSCGMFAVITLYMLICFDMNVPKAVEHVGVNGKQISNGRSIYDFTKALALSAKSQSIEVEGLSLGGEIVSTSASPAINQYLLNELDTIIGGAQSSRLSTVKIPAINEQLKSYVQSAREAVEQEVYEEILAAVQSDPALQTRSHSSHAHYIRSLPSFNSSLSEYTMDTIGNSLSDVMKFNQRVLKYKQKLLDMLSLSNLAYEYRALPAYKRSSLRDYVKRRLESLLHI